MILQKIDGQCVILICVRTTSTGMLFLSRFAPFWSFKLSKSTIGAPCDLKHWRPRCKVKLQRERDKESQGELRNLTMKLHPELFVVNEHPAFSGHKLIVFWAPV